MSNRRPTLIVFILTTVLLLTLAASCTHPGDPVYSKFLKIGADGWDPADLLVFEPVPADSADMKRGRFDIDLAFRFSTRRPIQSIPVAITVESYEGVVSADTVVIDLYDASGKPLGEGAYGVHTVTRRLVSDTPLPDNYEISLSPLSRRQASAGLLNVGVVMTPAGSSRDGIRIPFVNNF